MFLEESKMTQITRLFMLTLVHIKQAAVVWVLSFNILNFTLFFWYSDNTTPLSTSSYIGVFLVSLSQSIHLFLLFNPRPTCYTCVTLKCCLCIIICGWRVWVTLPLLSTQTTEVPLSKTLNTKKSSREAERWFKAAAGLSCRRLSQMYCDCVCHLLG